MFENEGVTLHITWIPVKMNCMKKKEIRPHLKSKSKELKMQKHTEI